MDTNHHPHTVEPAHPKVASALRGMRRRGDPSRHIGEDLIRQFIEFRVDPDTDHLTQSQQAEALGVSRSTVSNLQRTPGVWNAIRKARYEFRQEALLVVDEATFREAAKGNVAAARLAYERWDPAYLPRRAEVRVGVEAELARLQGMTVEELQTEAEKLAAEIQEITSQVAATSPKATAC
jgi:hypothetical protein